MPYLLRVRRFYATLSGRNLPRFLTNDRGTVRATWFCAYRVSSYQLPIDFESRPSTRVPTEVFQPLVPFSHEPLPYSVVAVEDHQRLGNGADIPRAHQQRGGADHLRHGAVIR